MSNTIRSARYANTEHTAIVATTAEAGDVAISERDRPQLWHHVHACGVAIHAYQPLGQLNGEAPEPQQMPLPDEPMRRPAPLEAGWVGRLVGKIDDEAEPRPNDELPVTIPEPPAPESIAMDDASRRRRAKAHVRGLAASFAFSSADEQMRYEEALMAHNGNVRAMQTFEAEARVHAISVKALAERVINDRTVKARRMMQVKAIHDQALLDLDNANGEEIAGIERRAVAAMNGESDASHS